MNDNAPSVIIEPTMREFHKRLLYDEIHTVPDWQQRADQFYTAMEYVLDGSVAWTNRGDGIERNGITSTVSWNKYCDDEIMMDLLYGFSQSGVDHDSLLITFIREMFSDLDDSIPDLIDVLAWLLGSRPYPVVANICDTLFDMQNMVTDLYSYYTLMSDDDGMKMYDGTFPVRYRDALRTYDDQAIITLNLILSTIISYDDDYDIDDMIADRYWDSQVLDDLGSSTPDHVIMVNARMGDYSRDHDA
jgi:hypothetical protein